MNALEIVLICLSGLGILLTFLLMYKRNRDLRKLLEILNTIDNNINKVYNTELLRELKNMIPKFEELEEYELAQRCVNLIDKLEEINKSDNI